MHSRVGTLSSLAGLFGLALILLALLTLLVLLPDIHVPIVPRPGHYPTAKRLQQAEHARKICTNPQNPCRVYQCNSSNALLRVCAGDVNGAIVTALQWMYLADSGEWAEGTSFIQRNPGKVERYLHNNGCREVVQ